MAPKFVLSYLEPLDLTLMILFLCWWYGRKGDIFLMVLSGSIMRCGLIEITGNTLPLKVSSDVGQKCSTWNWQDVWNRAGFKVPNQLLIPPRWKVSLNQIEAQECIWHTKRGIILRRSLSFLETDYNKFVKIVFIFSFLDKWDANIKVSIWESYECKIVSRIRDKNNPKFRVCMCT